MIEVSGLRKSFGDTRAVDGIDFEVRDGEIYGLLGPNGAGKTTTLSLINGLLVPDEGEVRFAGRSIAEDPLEVKRGLGVVPQEVALYEELSARENLQFWGALYGLSGAALRRATERALERVGLSARAKERVKNFSGGMKRRLNLSLGLIHDPAILLLDEPTVGIDPQARNSILELVREIAAGGATILYTTHYLEEVERLCDRIGILDHGKLLAEGTLAELNRLHGDRDLLTIHGRFGNGSLEARLQSLEGATVEQVEADRTVVSVDHRNGGAVAALSELLGGDLAIEGIEVAPPSLNALFLKLTGRELRD